MGRRDGTGGSAPAVGSDGRKGRRHPDEVILKAARRYARMAAAAEGKGDGTDGITLEGMIDATLFDAAGCDERIETLASDLKDALGPGRWHSFAARLQDLAATRREVAGCSEAIAVPIVGPARAMAGLIGDLDGIAAVMGTLTAHSVFGPGARLVAAPFTCSAVGLACAPPGALRRFVADATDESLDVDGEAVARAMTTFNGTGLRAALDLCSALPDDALVARAVVGVRMSPDGAIPAEALESWIESTRLALTGTGVDLGVPALPSRAARDLASMRVEGIVSQHRGRHGLGTRAKPVRSLILQDGKSLKVAFDHGCGILVGPVDVPVRIAAADKTHFHDLVQGFSGGEAVAYDDAACFDEAVHAVFRPSTCAPPPAGPGGDGEPSSMSPEVVTTDPHPRPGTQPRQAAAVVDLAARRRAREAGAAKGSDEGR